MFAVPLDRCGVRIQPYEQPFHGSKLTGTRVILRLPLDGKQIQPPLPISKVQVTMSLGCLFAGVVTQTG
jgi:hypothetical protein